MIVLSIISDTGWIWALGLILVSYLIYRMAFKWIPWLISDEFLGTKNVRLGWTVMLVIAVVAAIFGHQKFALILGIHAIVKDNVILSPILFIWSFIAIATIAATLLEFYFRFTVKEYREYLEQRSD